MLKRPLFTFLGLAALALLAPASAHAQLLGPEKVVVTNTASNPVPTLAQGTTTVAGTVQAQQAGAWSVEVKSSADKPLVVRDVGAAPARRPFQRRFAFNVQPGEIGAAESFTVPDGKRLVIEFVSLTAAMNRDTGATLHVETELADSGPVAHFFEAARGANTVADTTRVGLSQQTRLVADPNTTVTLRAFRSGSNAVLAGILASVAGYLEDAPPQSQQ